MRKHWILRLMAVLLGFTLLAAACSDDSEDTVELTQDGGVLAKVIDAGTLECGGNDTLPGFGIVDADSGAFSGFDIDFCRVIAAAVLGDAEAINVTPLVAAQRFPTLQSGEIDVLIRNTTWTASRDGSEQANFLHTTFFDGQGFMAGADAGIASLDDVANASICVLQGTTTLLNLNAVMGDLGIPFTAVEFESNDELNPAFQAGQCEVWTSDASQLAAFAANMDIPTVILPEIISKEPLGPVVADGDTEWAQVVDWATMATIQAWEFGITSENIGTFTDSEDSGIRRFLGLPITDDDGNEAIAEVGLGLPTDFAKNIIEQVGNYEEIFQRNLAPISLTLAGSPNDLWTNGGLQYVPPFR
ncbi:MAG: general L-amino acid transport system substrate-binding protein [Candidatus Aldehydirespiratoraceae bacterium]|jgi:general L-amino acid transport system substrate-binding protein